MTESMTDEEIRENLLKLGMNIGPVVDSTRDFYRRKLARLLGEVSDEPVSQDNDGEGSFCEIEDDEKTQHLNQQLWSSSNFVPPGEIRARRSIHLDKDRSTSFNFVAESNSSLNVSTRGPGSISSVHSQHTEAHGIMLICFVIGIGLILFIAYFYSTSTELALKG